MPNVPGYGADVSGLTIEYVPSALAKSCWLVCPCWQNRYYLALINSQRGYTHRFMIFKAILVFVCLLTTNNRAFEGLIFLLYALRTLDCGVDTLSCPNISHGLCSKYSQSTTYHRQKSTYSTDVVYTPHPSPVLQG